jgi:hypothetical protein
VAGHHPINIVQCLPERMLITRFEFSVSTLGFSKQVAEGFLKTSGNLDSGRSRNKTERWIFLVSSERMLRDDASAMFSHNSVVRQGARCAECPASTSPFPSL